ncbi:MAG: hypothetical protein KatS3mg027_0960 [Bacteroidia bacterium]|nr:MAG: hypothetical protein KatS3mg027_0960 [Bacteroidia bacterium]
MINSNNRITQLLTQEHETILQLGQILKKINGLWKNNEKKFIEIIDFLLHFCQIYADKIHHLKEEQILFPIMIEQNPMLEQGAVGEMNDQHEMFREFIIEIKIAMENKDFEIAYSIFQKYVELLSDHIQIENFEVFPMADDLLSSEINEQLYFKALDVDMEYSREKNELTQKVNQLLKDLNIVIS